MSRPPANPARPDSRSRLIVAARAEFAARGFAGGSVDRIAARARLNKAMIYYHFEDKEGLYRAVLQEMFTAVSARTGPLRDASAPPADRMRAFLAVFVDEATRRPDFPRVMLREVLESGSHLDGSTVEAMVVVPFTFLTILEQGIAQGAFRRVHPLLAYFAVIAPIVMTLASVPARARIGRLLARPGAGGAAARARRIPGGALETPAPADLLRHVQDLALATIGAPGPSTLEAVS